MESSSFVGGNVLDYFKFSKRFLLTFKIFDTFEISEDLSGLFTKVKGIFGLICPFSLTFSTYPSDPPFLGP